MMIARYVLVSVLMLLCTSVAFADATLNVYVSVKDKGPSKGTFVSARVYIEDMTRDETYFMSGRGITDGNGEVVIVFKGNFRFNSMQDSTITAGTFSRRTVVKERLTSGTESVRIRCGE